MKRKDSVINYILGNQVLVALGVIGLLWLLFQIKDVLVLIFISYIIMASLMPLVNFLVSQRIPRIIAVMIVFFTTLAVVILSIVPLIPFFASQIQALIKNFPAYLTGSSKVLGIKLNPDQLNSTFSSQIGGFWQNAFAVTSVIFGGFFAFITIVVITFYLLLDHNNIKKNIAALFPHELQKKVENTIDQIEDRLGAWFRGQLVLSLSIGILAYISYLILGLDYALPLAFIAAIFEAIPTIGAFLGAIPAVIVALTISPEKTVLVILIYIVIQTAEANFLVPKVMERAVGLSPIIVIIGIMLGANLMGIIGALLSIPFISVLIIIFNSFRSEI